MKSSASYSSHSIETASWIFLSLNIVVFVVTIVAACRSIMKIYQSFMQNVPRADGGVISLLVHLFLPWGPLLSILAISGSRQDSFYRPLHNPFTAASPPPLDDFSWKAFTEQLLISLSLLVYLATYPLLFIYWAYLGRLWRRAAASSSSSSASSPSAASSSTARLAIPHRSLAFAKQVLAVWGVFTAVLFLIWLLLMMLYATVPDATDEFVYAIALFIMLTYYLEAAAFFSSLASPNIRGRPVLRWFVVASGLLFLAVAVLQTLIYFDRPDDLQVHFPCVTACSVFRLGLPLLPLVVLHWRKTSPTRRISKRHSLPPQAFDPSTDTNSFHSFHEEFPPLLEQEEDLFEIANESFTDFLHNMEEPEPIID